jgi:hypothetical protein
MKMHSSQLNLTLTTAHISMLKYLFSCWLFPLPGKLCKQLLTCQDLLVYHMCAANINNCLNTLLKYLFSCWLFPLPGKLCKQLLTCQDLLVHHMCAANINNCLNTLNSLKINLLQFSPSSNRNHTQLQTGFGFFRSP